jgi:hypothetical protein
MNRQVNIDIGLFERLTGGTTMGVLQGFAAHAPGLPFNTPSAPGDRHELCPHRKTRRWT